MRYSCTEFKSDKKAANAHETHCCWN